ncbi:hypothetical protein Tco_0484161 [Tanacetum coccineum]
MSPGLSARVTEAMTLLDSAFRKRYRSSYETPSPSPSPTLLVRKRYWGTSKLILDTKTEDNKSKAKGAGSWSEESEDEGPDSEGEEAAPEGCHALDLAKEIAPSTFKIGQSSSFTIIPVIPIPVASLVTTPVATIAVNENEFLEAGHVDAQRAEMWQARYDDHRLIHDMLVQHTVMQRELQEMRDRVATLEEERRRREQ